MYQTIFYLSLLPFACFIYLVMRKIVKIHAATNQAILEQEAGYNRFKLIQNLNTDLHKQTVLLCALLMYCLIVLFYPF